jgi:hypothetical protein
VTARSPRPLSPAQTDVLTAAQLGHVTASEHMAERWLVDYPDGLRGGQRVSITVESLIRKGLLDVDITHPAGPRFATVTDAGRAMLAQTTTPNRP